MRVNRFRLLPILVVSGFLAATIQPAFADSASTSVSPQIVRLSYVEGDVRITRGKVADKQDAKENGASTGWEQAVNDLPIESGYSIVTGTGRAEIEFEDASTVYLADNSVLIFTELTSRAGVPYTELALLSGTATVNVHTVVPGEWFKVTTPTDVLSLSYPKKTVSRIDSYLDAVSITPQRDPSIAESVQLATPTRALGITTSYAHKAVVLRAVRVDPAIGAKWDAWVAERLTSRAEAMAATMKEAGLSQPIPGLAEMKDKGHFFACAPYGTCWEPTNGWDGKGTNLAQVSAESGAAAAQIAAASQTGSAGSGKPAKVPKPTASEKYLAANPGATLYTEDYYFPCNTFAVKELIAIDPVTHKEKIIDSTIDLNSRLLSPMMSSFGVRGPHRLFMTVDGWYPWDYAICHSGSWIRWNHHYAWVAGRNLHYNCPVRWVKNGHNSGFVPIHPHDTPGKPPINLKDGLFKYTGNHVQPFTRVGVQADKPVKVLGEPPKEFRKPEVMHLENAQVPHPEGHSAFAGVLAAKGALPSRDAPVAKGTTFASQTTRQNAEQNNAEFRNSEVRSSQTRKADTGSAGTPILFDRRSQTFSVERQVNVGGRSSTMREPIGRAGNYPANNPGNNGGPFRGASSTYSNGGNNSRPYSGGNSSRSYSPSQSSNGGNSNNGGGSRSYSPPPSYGGGNSNNGGGSRSYSPPPSSPSPPSYSPPPQPVQSAPAPSQSAATGTPTQASPVGR